MLSRNTGLLLIAAATLFWLSWWLMPGVGVTDAAEIFNLVGSRRPYVMLSVITQLLSAALYVPLCLRSAIPPIATECAGVLAFFSSVPWEPPSMQPSTCWL